MLTRLAPRGFDWSSAPLHPALVAAYPVLFLFAENAEQQVTLAPLWLPLAVCVGAGIGALLVLSGILRDWQRGALLASLLLALFFSYGHVWNLVGGFFGQRWVLAIVYGVVALAGLVLIWRGGRWVAPAGRFLNIAAVLLVAFNVFRVANYASESAAAAQGVAPPTDVTLHAPANPPDVYYIILDRYANVDTLKSAFDFDNEPFMRELEKRGFTIARHAWANYFKTAPSVYSSLQIQTIDKAKLGETEAPYDFTNLYAALRDHLAVPSALKSIGYHYIHLGNWWEPTSYNIDADTTLRFQESAEFSGALFSTTFMSLFSPPAEDSGGEGDDGETISRRDLARDSTLYTFDTLADMVDRPGPNFVFAHILLPHPPYIFNANGDFISEEKSRGRSERINYVQQVKFANKKVLAAVDRLLSDPNDPIIILQADEGPYPKAFTKDPKDFDWLSATPAEISQKFGILNAMHLPGVDPADFGFTEHTSPVNEFRIVFNAVFGADLPLLPDTTYLSPDYARVYDFVPYPHG
jgi:hypothetical protein